MSRFRDSVTTNGDNGPEEAAIRRGQLDIADAVRELDPSDAAALGELGLRRLELEEHYERDDLEDDPHSS